MRVEVRTDTGKRTEAWFRHLPERRDVIRLTHPPGRFRVIRREFVDTTIYWGHHDEHYRPPLDALIVEPLPPDLK